MAEDPPDYRNTTVQRTLLRQDSPLLDYDLGNHEAHGSNSHPIIEILLNP